MIRENDIDRIDNIIKCLSEIILKGCKEEMCCGVMEIASMTSALAELISARTKV